MKNGRKYLNLSRGEQIGFTLMAFLMLLIVASRAFIPTLFSKSKPVNIAQFDSIKNILFSENKSLPSSSTPFQTFSFNANTISYDSLLLFGLKTNEASTFINFRTAIGGFAKKEQLLKLYGFSDELRNRVFENAFISAKSKDQVVWSEQENLSKPVVEKTEWNKSKSSEIKKDVFKIELNSSSELQLQMIKGIGPALSKRIVNYRNSIGGFKQLSQLYDVYGLDSSNLNFDNIELSLDTNLVQKLRINDISAEDLAKHPVFWGKKAYIVINYRNEHGRFIKPSDLLNTRVISENELEEIKGYLQFD